jgi:hypothetical protein
MRYFQNFEYEIKINILRYVASPLNLSLTCRNWYFIVKDPYAKSEWLIAHYGKAHALSHAVNLGPTFIDISVCHALISRSDAISRYFIQRLIREKFDQQLIEPKLEYNVGHDVAHAFYQQSPWASNLPIAVFTYLFNELSNASKDLSSKDSNLNYALRMPRKNIKRRFTPFPLSVRPKVLQLNLKDDRRNHQSQVLEGHLFKDNYKNDKFFEFLRQGNFLRYYYLIILSIST